MAFKPMLAATCEDVAQLRYPLMVSSKLDGVRALVRGGQVLSRSFKPIPNLQVQRQFWRLEGYDGELIVGTASAPDVYRQTVSAVMTRDAVIPDLKFVVFDNFTNWAKYFHRRFEEIDAKYRLGHIQVHNPEQLLAVEAKVLAFGYEGLILRDPDGVYKFGRSTLNEGGMIKLKRFKDSEATVIGYEPLRSNQNEATVGELGQTVRSSHQANMVEQEMLGSLLVAWQGMSFNIGTGFDHNDREILWNMKETLPGRVCKFKYLEIGMKDKPRHPVFLGWRSSIDA